MAAEDDRAARADSLVGRVLKKKWRLDALVGAGGMGSVYAATHRNGKRVAVKVLHPELAVDQFWIADSKGYIWGARSGDGMAYAVGSSETVYYTSSNCSGTAYLYARTPGVVFSVYNDTTLRAVPPGATPSSVNYLSSVYSGGSCSTSGGTITAVPLSTTAPATPIVRPVQPLFTPPLAPVFTP